MAEPETKESKSELRHQAERAEALREAIAPKAPVEARPVRRYRALVFQGYLIAATLVFALLFFYARRIAYFDFDLSIARSLQRLHTVWLDVTMESVSGLGFNPLAGWFVGLTILFVYMIGLKWESVMLL